MRASLSQGGSNDRIRDEKYEVDDASSQSHSTPKVYRVYVWQTKRGEGELALEVEKRELSPDIWERLVRSGGTLAILLDECRE